MNSVPLRPCGKKNYLCLKANIPMSIKVHKASMILLLLLASFSLHAQYDISKYKIPEITDPFMPMITNRVVDSLGPSQYDLANEVDLHNPMKVFLVQAIGDSIYCRRMDRQLLDALFEQPGNDWLLLVHGDSKAPVDAAVRGLETQNMHHVKVLVFSWPSRAETRDGLKNFRNSKENVELGLGQFRDILLMLQKYRQSDTWPAGNHLSLLMHSLGNYYLELAQKSHLLDELGNGLFDNIIINAAAIELEGHNEWVESIQYARRIFIISNKGDFNLKGARFFTRAGPQLGGPVAPPLAKNAIYVNFTEAVGFKLPTWLSHTFFVGEIPAESSNIRKFYTTIFHGAMPDLRDEKVFRVREDGMGWDIVY